MPSRVGRSATCLLTTLVLLASPAVATGQLQAGPTLLELPPGGTATRLLLRNSGGDTVAAQVRVYAWSQQDGEDLLEPSDDLAVSPPILELPPASERVVRLVRVGEPAEEGRDRTFRVVVDELPAAETDGGSEVELRMRYVIPAFVRAEGAAAPRLACRIEGGAGGDRLICENAGGRAAQLGASRLFDAGGTELFLSEGLFGYVLPRSQRSWPLPPDRPSFGPTLRLDTLVNGQPTTVPVDRAR